VSVQFGRWNFAGQPSAPDYLNKVNTMLAPYGPDGGDCYSDGGVSILYRAFHTVKECRRERQPHISKSGAVITWDGRLDNRAEFIALMRDVLLADSPDVSIVVAAYERWGINCFARLIGDWALSIWNPGERALILAKDPIGTRHLYYSFDKTQTTWCSILEPLVLLAGRTFALEEEYIAGWLSFFPATHLTPYVGIHSVPPSSYIRVVPGRPTVSTFWDFNPNNRIRYRTDAEYEEHFRIILAESVRRRLRSDVPILAELSGGMDSSSIVCMADTVIARGQAETPRLDTVSYYDDSEPNWNERPYFTKVEEKRGRTGCHIDVGSHDTSNFAFESESFAVTPDSGLRPNEATVQLAACLISHGNRVVLSGIGGDEVAGGVPTPTPELADLLATARFRTLAHQLKLWALIKRKPWFHLLFDAARRFFPPALVGVETTRRPAAWLQTNFVRRNQAPLIGYQTRSRMFGPLPSFQENISTLDVLRRQLACSALPLQPTYEKRYPYLDRDLLEFMCTIPREQLVRPGQRRSLMRRALVGIVPDEILNRKRKAYVTRSLTPAVSTQWASLVATNEHMISGSLGIVDPKGISEVLQRAKHGEQVPIIPLLRSAYVETWLRNLVRWKVLPDMPNEGQQNWAMYSV